MSGKSDVQLAEDPKITHPVDPSLPFFLSHDAVHATKNLRNNLLRPKANFWTEKGCITWGLLRELHRVDSTSTLKMAPGLTPLVVDPVGFNRQKVSLALTAIGHRTRNALRWYAQQDPVRFPPADVDATLEYFENAHEFFTILNVNHPRKGAFKSCQDPRLQKLLSLKTYFEGLPLGILTSETRPVVIQICNASVQIISYLLQNHVSSVLTARFNQDKLEEYALRHN